MQEKLQYVYLSLFLTGLLVGILLVQWQDKEIVSSVFSEYFLNQYASWKIDEKRLLSYIGGYRIRQYLLVIGCGLVKCAAACMGLLLFLLGMVCGSVLSISVLRLGMKGLLICIAGTLPQIIFYLPAYGWGLCWIFQNGYRKRNYLLLTFIGFFVLFLGVLCEVYLNPQILKQILQKM
jgi:hypothetical protein